MPDEKVLDNKFDESNAQAYLLIALCAVAASTMFVEIVIVKFIAFKVFHNFISVIVSTVVLSFAASGTYLYLRKSKEENPWSYAGREAAIYSITLILAVLAFCWLPIDPYNRDLSIVFRIAAIPIYFALLFGPFFFGGLCISRVLAESSIKPSRVLFFDLLSAATAAALAPTALELLGGYGAIGTAAFIGMIGSYFFDRAAGSVKRKSLTVRGISFAVVLAMLLTYPGWAMKEYGLDIRTNKGKNLTDIIQNSMHGIKQTYWNALARIDVSGIGWSNKFAFLYGMDPNKEKRQGRVINVDQGANTRQFVNDGPLSSKKFFGKSILATAYVARPDAKDSLIIGGGGGLDITVAKYFKIPRVDVLEMNPMMYKHVLLGEGDPDRDKFEKWLISDENTKVDIFQTEARHFCTRAKPGTYDVIQATGVDTFTAVSSGALVFSDNYLYTYDAINSYIKLLKQDGVLSLVYGREPKSFPLRLLSTYIANLENRGVKEPWRNVAVVGSGDVNVLGSGLASVMLKPTAFTEEESQRLRQWCLETGNTLILDPYRKIDDLNDVPEAEHFYTKLAQASHEERAKLIEEYDFKISPATDDRPYFYIMDKDESWLFSSNYAYTPIAVIALISIFALVLMVMPMVKLGVKNFSSNLILHALFFALCGFSFLFFEVAIIQLFTVFVGGPMYSLAVVLVSVLAGYSLGCFVVGKLPVQPKTYFVIGCILLVANLTACFCLPELINSMLIFELPLRLASCALITIFLSALAGLSVPLAMESVKKNFAGNELAWFWGVNCAFNALGAACYPVISINTGIRSTLTLVAVLYFLANCLFAFLLISQTRKNKKEAK